MFIPGLFHELLCLLTWFAHNKFSNSWRCPRNSKSEQVFASGRVCNEVNEEGCARLPLNCQQKATASCLFPATLQIVKIWLLICHFYCSDMDGMGSPDGMMDHSMMDLKGGMGSPYSCYSSPKLPYDSFSNRGGLEYHLSWLLICSSGGLNLNLMKTESLWHLNQHAAGYGSSYGQSPHYGLPSSPLPTGAVLWAPNGNSFWDENLYSSLDLGQVEIMRSSHH